MPIKLNEAPDGTVPMLPIAFAKIKEMTDYYRASAPAGDPKSIWVSRKEVNQLLDDNGGNGIRIYFGRYTEESPEAERNRLTVILVSTYDKDNPVNPTTANSKSQLKEQKTDDIDANSVIAKLWFESEGDFTGMGDDAVPLCPQNCPKEPGGLD